MVSNKLKLYIELIERWNKKLNLVSYKNRNELLIKHIFDSLSIIEVYSFDKEHNIVDMGSGCGLPGIPLSIIFPEKYFYLVEPRKKYVMFLKKVKQELNLENVEIIDKRIENSVELQDKTDVVLVRAVGSIKEVLGTVLPFLSYGCKIIFYKARNILNELEQNREFLVKKRLRVLLLKKSGIMEKFGLTHYFCIISA